MTRDGRPSSYEKLSAETRSLVDFAEHKIAKAITASNVLTVRLSHEKSILGDEHITGRVGGGAQGKWKDAPEKKQRARKSLGVPISRKGRPITDDGRVTFHLRNTPVRASAIDTGKLGSAGHHDHYLNRDGAVPSIQLRQAITPEDQGRYIERDAAAEAIDGRPVILSNISPDPKVRSDFHARMEAVERVSCSQTRRKKIRLNVTGNTEFYQSLLQEGALPPNVRLGIETSLQDHQGGNAQSHSSGEDTTENKHEHVIVEADDVRCVRGGLEKAGWKKNNERWSKIASFDQGSSPQIYHRIEGELPSELSLLQRKNALERICRLFKIENLPYVAVLHAPDATNDPENVHFHILYYSRPAELMTQDRDRHFAPHTLHAGHILAKNPESGLTKTQRQMELRREAWPQDTPLPVAFEGQWDFEVTYRYKSGKRSYKTTRPFQQKKSRRVVSKAWPKELRAHVAKSINDELVEAGLKPRFHPGSFDDLGIDKKPETKLFKDQIDRELRGIPTLAGLDNENSDWDYRVGKLEKLRTTRHHMLADRTEKLAKQFCQVNGRSPESRDAFNIALAEYSAQRASAIQAEFESNLASEYIERLRSRAKMVSNRNDAIVTDAERQITVLGNVPSKELAAAQRRKAIAEEAIVEAQEYIFGLNHEIGEALALPSRKMDEEGIARRRSKTVLRAIRKMLTDEPELAAAPQLESVISPITPTAADQVKSEPVEPVEPVEAPIKVSALPPTIQKPMAPKPGEQLAARLMEGKTRLKENDHGRIVPVTFSSEAEKLLVENAAYLKSQPALRKVMQSQDKRIANVLEYLIASPDGLELRHPNAEPVSRRYELKVNVPQYRSDFLLFGDDPQIIAGVENAIRRLAQKRFDAARQEAFERLAKSKAEKIRQDRRRAQETSNTSINTVAPAPQDAAPAVKHQPDNRVVDKPSTDKIRPVSASITRPSTESSRDSELRSVVAASSRKGENSAGNKGTNEPHHKVIGHNRAAMTSSHNVRFLAPLAKQSDYDNSEQSGPVKDLSLRHAEKPTSVSKPSLVDTAIKSLGNSASAQHPASDDISLKPHQTNTRSVEPNENPAAHTVKGQKSHPPVQDQKTVKSRFMSALISRSEANDTHLQADQKAKAFVESSANDTFIVEEGHKGMVVPYLPTMMKYDLHDAALLHPVVQANLQRRLVKQRTDERALLPLLARYSHEEDMSDDDKIIGRMPDGEHRRLVEHWRGTGLLQMMLARMRDDQKRHTEKLYRKWRKARDEGSADRASCAGMALAQQQRWPIELPQEHQKAMEQDAVLHRQRLRQVQVQQQGMGL